MSGFDIDDELAAARGVPNRPLHLRDADAMRALAHPARQRVINVMFADQRAHTSTELSELTGLTPSAMSYHLRALEKVGLVERVEAAEGDSRTRPWRAAGTSISIHGSDSDDVWESMDALTSVTLDNLRRRLAASRANPSTGTGSYIGIGEATMWLTEEEAARYAQALQRAELDLVQSGWVNEPGPRRRLTQALFSLLPETAVESSDDSS